MAGESTGYPASGRIRSGAHRWRLHVLLALALITGATGGHVLLRQRTERIALTRNATVLRENLTALNARRTAIEAELAMARKQLAEIESLRSAATAGESDPNGLRAWLAREKRLREMVKEQPDQCIPELQLLTDDDWLRVARDARLDTPEHRRRALATLRDAAKRHFQLRLSKAFAAFLRKSNGELPTSTFALAPYFDTPPDLAMLARYAVVATQATKDNPFMSKVIEEKTPIDADYDSRFSIARNSAAMTYQAPEAWIPDFEERNRAAWTAYRQSHPGLDPENRSELLPYFDPPLDPALVEKIIRAERERPDW